MAVLAALVLAGCHGEKDLVPTQLGSITDKFDFPQGTSEADEIFERIYEKYGTKVIYKDFTVMDLERSWVSQVDSGGGEVKYMFDYVTDPDKLLEAARTFENKIFGLMPEETVRTIMRAYPYIYLLDNLHYQQAGKVYTEIIYPVKPLDGIAVNLQLGAAADDYTAKVYHPVRLAAEFLARGVVRGTIEIPAEFNDLKGTMQVGNLTSFLVVSADPERYDNYWARQGRLPFISTSGMAGVGKTSKGQQNVPMNKDLSDTQRDVPWAFIFLSTDRNWRTYDDQRGVMDDTNTGVFYDCPRLVERLEVLTRAMKEQGIDFDEIQRRLYDDPDDNSTVVTNPW
jgi:hypothetical protein